MQLALDDRGGRRKIPPVDVVDENGKRQERHQPFRRYISLSPPDCRYHVVSGGVSAPQVANRSETRVFSKSANGRGLSCRRIGVVATPTQGTSGTDESRLSVPR